MGADGACLPRRGEPRATRATGATVRDSDTTVASAESRVGSDHADVEPPLRRGPGSGGADGEEAEQ